MEDKTFAEENFKMAKGELKELTLIRDDDYTKHQDEFPSVVHGMFIFYKLQHYLPDV